MPLASRLAALFGSPWQPAQSPLNSFIPAIKFSSVGAIGFARREARRAAAESSAIRANAFSSAEGLAFGLIGNHPIHAAPNALAGSVTIPTTNPSRNFAHHPSCVLDYRWCNSIMISSLVIRETDSSAARAALVGFSD